MFVAIDAVVFALLGADAAPLQLAAGVAGAVRAAHDIAVEEPAPAPRGDAHGVQKEGGTHVYGQDPALDERGPDQVYEVGAVVSVKARARGKIPT